MTLFRRDLDMINRALLHRSKYEVFALRDMEFLMFLRSEREAVFEMRV